MKTKTYEPVKKQATSQECKAVPCDIPPFCRNNYFTGKLLTERDLTAEQRYVSDKLRLHHLALHGWGVICGLKVKSHPYCPNLRVIVEPGLAVDACGRFIRVLKETEIELPQPPSEGVEKDPCPPDVSKGSYQQGGYAEGSQGGPQGYGQGGAQGYGQGGSQGYGQGGSQGHGQGGSQGYGQGGSQGYGQGGSQGSGQGGSQGYGQGGSQGYGQGSSQGYGQGSSEGYGQGSSPGYEQGSSYQDRPFEQDYGEQPPKPYQPNVNLYFCLSYAECDDEMMPAPFDECACTGNGQRPNRTCETFELTVRTEPPPGLDEVEKRKNLCLVDDCTDLYKKVLDDCGQPTALECLPLAVVEGHVLGDPVIDDQIDNWTVRPILPSTQLLNELIYCMLHKVSTKSLTKIVDISWQHRGEYQTQDFMRQFISDNQKVRGFEITFGGPIRPEGITRRTFQAIAVRYGDRYSGGQMEVVPARVRVREDRSRALLEIDRGYAERRLYGTRFDLFLRLRCGHVLDDNGLPIDGEMLAKIDSDGNYVVAPPTGDGVEGGLFESWIRVRTGPREEQGGAY